MHETKQKYKVLMIDDELLGADIVRHILQAEPDFGFDYVHDAARALDEALLCNPTVVLVDLRMPLIDGFELIKQFRNHPATARLPIVMLSSDDDPELKVKGFSSGANDYLVKWPHRRELVARLRYHSMAYQALEERDAAYSSLERSQKELLLRTKELADSQAALLQVQKMDALGNLTGGIAHDFNNVLQIVNGSLNLLKLYNENNPQAIKRIDTALNGVRRGSTLSSQLLSFARRQSLHPRVVDVGTLLHDVTQLLRHGLGVSTKLELDVDARVWNVMVDSSKLENVLFNLAINARDAMRDNSGLIRIEAHNVTMDRFDLEPGQYVKLSVIDNGAGMTQDVADRVFEPFFTTKPNGQGSGLGLSMAYGFVKQSSGHIELKSHPGKGTTVDIYLPRTLEDMPHTVIDSSEEEIPAGKETILVVEDEEDVRSNTAELLESMGYTVLQAHDGQSALDIVEGHAKIDMIFTDVVMPGPLRSVDFVAAAKKFRPNLPVLFTSGYVQLDVLYEWSGRADIKLLTKPYSAEELNRKLRELLADERARARGRLS